MDPVLSGGPWIPGPCFVLTPRQLELLPKSRDGLIFRESTVYILLHTERTWAGEIVIFIRDLKIKNKSFEFLDSMKFNACMK